MVEYNMQKREKDLENMKNVVVEFKKRLNAKVRRQENLDIAEESDFRRKKLLKKYIMKILYKQNNGKFENKYLKKLEKNWQKQKSVSLEKKY